MTDRDFWTIKAMKKFGGGFVKALGEACSHADPNNLAIIKSAFHMYRQQYESMGISLERIDK